MSFINVYNLILILYKYILNIYSLIDSHICEFVHKHIIMFELNCLIKEPKLRLEIDSFAK